MTDDLYWLEITLTVSPQLAESCSAALLEETGRGTYQLEAEDEGGRPLIRGFLARDEACRSRLVRLKKRIETLFSFFPELQSPFWELKLIPSENWQENWKRNFKPFRVCSGLMVCPTWETLEAAEGEKILRLDPGQAFGTGGHATTHLCLQMMEYLKLNTLGDPFGRVLDVGTGTGILALVAAFFGARSVLAIDLDPLAVESARGHVELNDLAAVIRVAEGGPESVSGPFTLILANLTRDDLLPLAGVLKGLLASGGFLILSGFLETQSREVIRTYMWRKLLFQGLALEGEWGCALFRSIPE
ncbi:MAG: 50S ribosomal protein L11 methyltransferase [Deltaproteobacteria bacterium]|nr:50S ribosomal protein L11 methyltransferase [Deltaproteobacteria bacterium]